MFFHILHLCGREQLFQIRECAVGDNFPFMQNGNSVGELFRFLSYQEIGSAAMLSRACAGSIGKTAVFCLPGSEEAVRLGMLKLILPEIGHVVRELTR